jgi:hypothetical protein
LLISQILREVKEVAVDWSAGVVIHAEETIRCSDAEIA